MKSLLISLKLATVAALLLIVGCATSQNRENMLVASGFKAKIARTAKQQQHLQSLPSGKITLVQRNGKTFYVYPDKVHNIAYVGTPDQYQAYQQLRLQNQANAATLEAAELNDQAVIDTQQSAFYNQQGGMGWGVWGPDFWY